MDEKHKTCPLLVILPNTDYRSHTNCLKEECEFWCDEVRITVGFLIKTKIVYPPECSFKRSIRILHNIWRLI